MVVVGRNDDGVNIRLTTLLLTRHGHVEGINPERFRGRAELPLTELGVHQAQALARRIAATWQPAAIYTSPMSRCIATGQEIARACGADTTVLEELNDLDYGDWQGQTHEEVGAHSPDSFDLWHRAPHLPAYFAWIGIPHSGGLPKRDNCASSDYQ
jgi:broad specificity phosphatase PhoE